MHTVVVYKVVCTVCVPGTVLGTGAKSGEQHRKSFHPLRAQILM